MQRHANLGVLRRSGFEPQLYRRMNSTQLPRLTRLHPCDGACRWVIDPFVSYPPARTRRSNGARWQ